MDFIIDLCLFYRSIISFSYFMIRLILYFDIRILGETLELLSFAFFLLLLVYWIYYFIRLFHFFLGAMEFLIYGSTAKYDELLNTHQLTLDLLLDDEGIKFEVKASPRLAT